MNILVENVNVELVIREDDGMAWYENETIYINARWLTDDIDDVVKEIIMSFIHEYVEHVIGLGHEAAEAVESILEKLI